MMVSPLSLSRVDDSRIDLSSLNGRRRRRSQSAFDHHHHKTTSDDDDDDKRSKEKRKKVSVVVVVVVVFSKVDSLSLSLFSKVDHQSALDDSEFLCAFAKALKVCFRSTLSRAFFLTTFSDKKYLRES